MPEQPTVEGTRRRDCRAVVRQRSRYDPHLPPHPDLANSAQHPTRWREVGLNHVATTPPLQVPLGRLSPRIKTAHWSANQPTEGSIPALPVANHTAQPCIALLVRLHPLQTIGRASWRERVWP